MEILKLNWIVSHLTFTYFKQKEVKIVLLKTIYLTIVFRIYWCAETTFYNNWVTIWILIEICGLMVRNKYIVTFWKRLIYKVREDQVAFSNDGTRHSMRTLRLENVMVIWAFYVTDENIYTWAIVFAKRRDNDCSLVITKVPWKKNHIPDMSPTELKVQHTRHLFL
jgi:hypothetical protein